MKAPSTMMIRVGAACLAIPALVVASIASSSSNARDETPPAAAPVEPLPHAGRIVAPGLVEPISEEIEIAADVIGRLKSVPVDEGDRIAKGQILAEIENADLKAALAVAEANVEKRRAALDRLRNGAREEERDQAAANLAEATAREAQAHRDLARKTPLAATGVESRSSLDDAAATAAAAEARRAAMTAQQALIAGAPRPEDLRIAEAELAEAEANVAGIQAQLDKTIIRSPIDGVVLSRQKKTGEAVANLPPTPILHIGDISRLRVRADVDEADIARVTVGQRVWVRADAFGDRRFGGAIVRVATSLGRKNFRTDRPTEKVDTKVLETLIELDRDVHLPVGLRVDVWSAAAGASMNPPTESYAVSGAVSGAISGAASSVATPHDIASDGPPGIAPSMIDPIASGMIDPITIAPMTMMPIATPVAPSSLAEIDRADIESLARVAAASSLDPLSSFAASDASTIETQIYVAPFRQQPIAIAPLAMTTIATPIAVASLEFVAIATETNPASASDGNVASAITPALYGASLDGARVVLRATNEVWIQISDADGKTIFTHILKSGDRYAVPDQTGLVLVAGNAAGLDVAVDGESIPMLGKPNQVVRGVSLDPGRLLQRVASAR